MCRFAAKAYNEMNNPCDQQYTVLLSQSIVMELGFSQVMFLLCHWHRAICKFVWCFIFSYVVCLFASLFLCFVFLSDVANVKPDLR